MKPIDANASYREPLEPPPAVDPLDAALAREIYESRNADALAAEAAKREEAAKKARERRRRPRRMEIESAERHLIFVVRQTRSERRRELLGLSVYCSLFLFIPAMPFIFGLVGDFSALLLVGSLLTIVTLIAGVWFIREVWPHSICDSLRLRVTPLHFELFWHGHRYIGERDELELDIRGDRITVRTNDGRFRFNNLHIDDVNTAVAFFRAQKLKID